MKNFVIVHKHKVFAVFISLIVTLVYCLAVGIDYTVADDSLINYFTQGWYGKGIFQILIPYVSEILTFLLWVLHCIIPEINWYLVLLLGLNVLIFAIWHIMFFNKKLGRITHICLIVFQIIVLFRITYTIMAYLAVFSGSATLLKGITKKEKILGSVLIFLGIALRKDVWITTLLLIFPWMLFELMEKKSSMMKEFIKILCIYVSAFVIVTGTAHYMKNINDVNQEYHHWNEASTKIRDYVKIPYWDNQEMYETLNLSENDVEGLYEWMFADKDRFGTENLEKIAAERAFYQTYELNPIGIMKAYMQNPIYIFVAIVILLLILFIFKVRHWCAWATMAMFALEMLMLIVRQRVVFRVYFSFIVIFCCILIYNSKEFFDVRIANLKIRKFVESIIVVSSISFSIVFSVIPLPKEEWITKKEELRNYVKRNEDKFYVCDSFYLMKKLQENVSTIYSKDSYLTNLMTWGDWSSFSLQYYEQLNRNQIVCSENIFQALLEDKVYLIGGNWDKINILKRYYKEHYGHSIKIRAIKKIGNNYIYKIKEKKSDGVQSKKF